MSSLDPPLINIRGGAILTAQAQLQAAFPHLDAEPNRYWREEVDGDAGGMSWLALIEFGGARYSPKSVEDD